MSSPFAFRFAGTRETGVCAGAREDSRELSRNIGWAAGGGIDGRDALRGFVIVEVGGGFEIGSALERMLEKDIGSAGLLGGVAATGGSCLTGGSISIFIAILGECDMRCGWACETGDRGAGEVYVPL